MKLDEINWCFGCQGQVFPLSLVNSKAKGKLMKIFVKEVERSCEKWTIDEFGNIANEMNQMNLGFWWIEK